METGLKRSRSSSLAAATGPQRVPLGPTKVSTTVAPSQVHARPVPARVYRPHIPLPTTRRIPVPQEPLVPVAVPEVHEDVMDVEAHPATHVVDQYASEEDELQLSDREEELLQDEDDEGEVSEDEEPLAKRPRIWPDISTERAQRYRREIEDIKEHFHDEIEDHDTTMVSEYADDIFDYMQELEVSRPLILNPC